MLIQHQLRSAITVIFPIFASYKALRTSDPAQLTPWLMYWVVLSLFSLFDYWTYFILSWLPFYALFRLVLFSYLVLPQTQGAKFLYQTYVHPFLAHHEHDIDIFIGKAHDQAIKLGLQYIKQAIEFLKQNVLGIQPEPKVLPGNVSAGSYAQSLLSQFNLPSARQGLAAPAGDFYSLLSSAIGTLNSTAGRSREAQAEDLSRSGTLIPEGMTSTTEKMTFLTQQREHLRVLLSALDKQASDLGQEAAIEKDVDRRLTGAQLGEGLKQVRSTTPFEEIGRDEGGPEGKVGAAGSWIPWGWGSKEAQGHSSGVDAGDEAKG